MADHTTYGLVCSELSEDLSKSNLGELKLDSFQHSYKSFDAERIQECKYVTFDETREICNIRSLGVLPDSTCYTHTHKQTGTEAQF